MEKTRVMAELQKAGYESAISFLRAHEGVSYHELSRRLDGVVPNALVNQALSEADEAAEQWWFVADSAVREIRDVCTDGWRHGESGDFQAAHALGAWAATVEPLGPRWFDLAKRAGELLFEAEGGPRGWLPKSTGDQFLLRALRAAGNGRGNGLR